jgi:hypothetical protein
VLAIDDFRAVAIAASNDAGKSQQRASDSGAQASGPLDFACPEVFCTTISDP